MQLSLVDITMVSSSQIKSWVGESILKENLKNYQINIVGSSGKDEGFLGDIIFVEVEGTTEQGQPKNLNLVVKHAKFNEYFRKTAPMKDIFENEIYMYTKVIPTFQKFQSERRIMNIFDCIAKCFYTFSSNDMEVLILENLRTAGFEQYDRMKPMNLSHCKAILEQCGRYHAISFAMRDQNKEAFTNLVSKVHNIPVKLFEPAEIGDVMEDAREIVLDIFQKKGDVVLHEKLSKVLQRGSHAVMLEVLNMKESQSVITHGDCWSNNFLFKYEEGNKENPVEIAILDWQQASLRSPVFDISYLLYSTCSKKELDSFEDLLGFYYNSFATHLTELGSDPEKLFTYSDLKSHWRKYSIFQMINMTSGLRLFLCDKDDAPSFGDIGGQGDLRQMFKNIKHDQRNLYYDRIKAVVLHYFEYLEKDW